MQQAAITSARTESDFAEAARLMQAYKVWLGLAIFDNPGQRADEVLPGPYAAPDAGILLAWPADAPRAEALGVVAFKGITLPDGDPAAEMKRLYVAEKGQGAGLGRALSLAVMQAARAAGHRRMVLDTLDRLVPARRLYEGLGFVEVARYNDNPVAGVMFYGIDL